MRNTTEWYTLVGVVVVAVAVHVAREVVAHVVASVSEEVVQGGVVAVSVAVAVVVEHKDEVCAQRTCAWMVFAVVSCEADMLQALWVACECVAEHAGGMAELAAVQKRKVTCPSVLVKVAGRVIVVVVAAVAV